MFQYNFQKDKKIRIKYEYFMQICLIIKTEKTEKI